MSLLERAKGADGQMDLGQLLAQIPYAAWLGVTLRFDSGQVITELPFAEHLVGNTNLPAVHGGAVGALLEMTAVLQLLADTSCTKLPKTVDVSFDYLRSAGAATTYGRAVVTRRGRRVANVRSELWQADPDKPVAVSHGHFLLT